MLPEAKAAFEETARTIDKIVQMGKVAVEKSKTSSEEALQVAYSVQAQAFYAAAGLSISMLKNIYWLHIAVDGTSEEIKQMIANAEVVSNDLARLLM